MEQKIQGITSESLASKEKTQRRTECKETKKHAKTGGYKNYPELVSESKRHSTMEKHHIENN